MGGRSRVNANNVMKYHGHLIHQVGMVMCNMSDLVDKHLLTGDTSNVVEYDKSTYVSGRSGSGGCVE